MKLLANIVDILGREIMPGEIVVEGTKIDTISRLGDAIDPSLPFALPGFIDAHIHVESSMLVPSEFARLASVHGTVGTVSDPHEIANVMGVEGIGFMIENAARVPFKFCFGAPSCVPATAFETSGARLDAEMVEALLARREIGYLAEVMNYPGVLFGDAEVLAKIEAAKAAGKPIDGHAPGLVGDQAAAYIAAGISTDHECTTHAEAIDKLQHGMKILIREGSAAKNFDALKSLIESHPASVMFCSDDKHPDELAEGHIDALVRHAVADGFDLFNVLRIACLNPIEHYRLPVGQLRVGDPADFIVVEDVKSFRVLQTFINGQCVAKAGATLLPYLSTDTINHFHCDPVRPDDFRISGSATATTLTQAVRVIQAIDGKLVTGNLTATLPVQESLIVADPTQDILKIAVVNRYLSAPPAIAFITGFGLRRGAIASSVGHDSHNILAVGVDDESLAQAVNCVIAKCGGIVAVDGEACCMLPLPIAGIMSDREGTWVANEYRRVDDFAKRKLGSTLSAPFMTLSFMGLLVIPKLKLSDRGLFDVERFKFVSVTI